MGQTDMTKKVLAITIVAAVSSVAVYAYIQKKKRDRAKRRNLPVNFI
ncbi:hypothetical protein GGR21_003532 [Dysgonomonas hofstadii]|uniref:Uncharacterized protein n=1 Tax=Dysgonomonas hofstadii TaxID=637886 RepID=A0A840CYX4_9BACT|nr:hypothetical protein [Dysgonomonas hofstadii]MBB4037612.1 hypothetical protein [Dysgonomonas hofstadii]